jgi:hypothetical protein
MASPRKKKGKVRKVRSPLAEVTERFGSKEALVKEIEKLTSKKDFLVEKFSEKGIERVSNSKLLRLHRLVTEVSDEFANRAALVDAYLELKHRSKDEPYREKLMTYTLGRLYDMYQVAQRKAPQKA